MAEELQVVVQQNVGTIAWNYEELKAALAERMEEYEELVYTDGNIREAKADVAMLRKLRKSVEDRRKEIKTKCLEPYTAIETQAKELTDLIDKPITLIDAQIKTYEAQRREKTREEIIAYMNEQYADFPTEIRERLIAKIYDDRWENATAEKKAWQEAIVISTMQTRSALNIINDVEEEFRDKAMAIYASTFALEDALGKVTELRKQKEEILERERKRREQEERERLEAAQRSQYEAEKNAQEAQNAAQTRTEAQTDNVTPETAESVSEPVRGSEKPQEAAEDETHTIIFRVTAGKQTLNSIYSFIKASGAAFKWREETNV